MQATDIFPVRTQTRYGFHVSPDALSLYERLVDEFPLPETRMAYLLEDAVYERRREEGPFSCFSNSMLVSVFEHAAATYEPRFGFRTTLLEDVLALALSDQADTLLERARRAALTDLDERVQRVWEEYRVAVFHPADPATGRRPLVDVLHWGADAPPRQPRDCLLSGRKLAAINQGDIEQHLARELMRYGEPTLVRPHPRLRRMIERYVLASIHIPGELGNPPVPASTASGGAAPFDFHGAFIAAFADPSPAPGDFHSAFIKSHLLPNARQEFMGRLRATADYCDVCVEESLAIAMQRQSEVFDIASIGRG